MPALVRLAGICALAALAAVAACGGDDGSSSPSGGVAGPGGSGGSSGGSSGGTTGGASGSSTGGSAGSSTGGSSGKQSGGSSGGGQAGSGASGASGGPAAGSAGAAAAGASGASGAGAAGASGGGQAGGGQAGGGAGQGGSAGASGQAGQAGGPTAPAGWTCAPANYNEGAGSTSYCDCECGVHDPDCDLGLPVYHCPHANDTCGADDKCVTGPTAPKEWTCDPEHYGDGVCDCGCGAPDFGDDCKAPTPPIYGCNPSQTSCDAMGKCAGGTPTPAGWTCAPEYWNEGPGEGHFCDCGCGVADPDCALSPPLEVQANCDSGMCADDKLTCK